jgi:hypothetical protein
MGESADRKANCVPRRIAAALALVCAACGGSALAPNGPASGGVAMVGEDTEAAAAAGSAEVAASDSGASRIRLDRRAYAPGETMTVEFTAPPGLPADAWIGLLPAMVAHGSETVCDQSDVAYELLGGRTSGTVTLVAPDRRGPWDVRMFDTDANGREVASTTFQVR